MWWLFTWRQKLLREIGIEFEIIPPEYDEKITDRHFSDEIIKNIAINKANDSCYGLAAGIITEDKKLYEKFENKIQAGIISWNKQLTGASKYAPFGGIKDSGNYRPSGFLASDYVVYSTASQEKEKLSEITKLPNGITL